MKKLIALCCLLLVGCTSLPEQVKPVENFELDRYLGKWFEIARLDHRFERGLSNVSAEYSLRSDGGVSVLNRGYSEKKQKWQDAQGKAYFVDAKDEGFLKVSFFGPFYGSYAVFELDQENYQYAFVSGPDLDYLWFLSRTPTVQPALMERFIAAAAQRGFNTDNLIFVDQSE